MRRTALTLALLLVGASAPEAARRSPRPKPGATATVTVPVTGSATTPDGRPITISGSVTVTVGDAPAPTPGPVLTAFEFVGATPVRAPGGTTVRVTVGSPVPVDTPVGLVASLPLARPDLLVIRKGATQASASIFVGAAVAGSTTSVTLTATLGSSTRTLLLTVLGPAVPPGAPVIKSYTAPGGAPLLAGPLAAGQGIEIHGAGFGGSGGQLEFNAHPFAVQSWTDTTLALTLPDPFGYPSLSAFTVRRPDGATITARAFLDNAPALPDAPRITGLTNAAGAPVTAAAPGEVLTVTGERLGTSGTVLVKAVGPAEVRSWSETAVRFVVPFAWWEEKTGPLELSGDRAGEPISAGSGPFTARAGLSPAAPEPPPLSRLRRPAPGAPAAELAVQARSQAHLAALLTGDVTAILAFYGAGYQGEAGNKADLQQYLAWYYGAWSLTGLVTVGEEYLPSAAGLLVTQRLRLRLTEQGKAGEAPATRDVGRIVQWAREEGVWVIVGEQVGRISGP